VGLYWLSFRLLAIPTALIGEAVSTVYFQRLASLQAHGQHGARVTTRVFVALVAGAIVPMALLFAFAPALFGILFGPTWIAAGDYARALIPAQLMLFAVLPLTQTFSIYEKQEIGLLWNVGFLAVSLTTFALGRALGGPLAAVQWYSWGSAAMYGLVAVMAFRWSGGVILDVPSYFIPGLGGAPNHEHRS
jgi:O-antigen/teichoic acid export membrane protein